VSERPAKRFAAAVRRFNRDPRLVELLRRTRERSLGGDDHIDHLSTARGRPSDLAARQLVSLRGDRPGFAGELGLTALQAWQRLAEKQDRGRGKVDVAIEASDLTLVSGDLRAAADAIRLARRTLRTIKGNLFWAFAYNVAAIPLAVAGLLSPIVAAAAMAASSLFVVSNSLRLRRFRSARTSTEGAQT